MSAIEDANHLEPRKTLRVGTCLVVPLTEDAVPSDRTRKPPCDPNKSDDSKSADSSSVAGKPGASNTRDSTNSTVARGPHAAPKTSGIVHLVRGGLTFQGKLIDNKGKPIRSAVEKVDLLLFDRRTSNTHPTNPALLKKITEVSNHFGGRRILVVSGFRDDSSSPHTAHSNHALGRAIDFQVEGVPNTEVRDFCQTLPNAGVGYYPNSSFIHLDARNVSVHWTDVSGPGEAPRYTSVVSPPNQPKQTAKKQGKKR